MIMTIDDREKTIRREAVLDILDYRMILREFKFRENRACAGKAQQIGTIWRRRRAAKSAKRFGHGAPHFFCFAPPRLITIVLWFMIPRETGYYTVFCVTFRTATRPFFFRTAIAIKLEIGAREVRTPYLPVRFPAPPDASHPPMGMEPSVAARGDLAIGDFAVSPYWRCETSAPVGRRR